MLGILPVHPHRRRRLHKGHRRSSRLEKDIPSPIFFEYPYPIPADLVFVPDPVTQVERELIIPFNCLIIKDISLRSKIREELLVRGIKVFVKSELVHRGQHRPVSYIHSSRQGLKVDRPQPRDADASMLV